MSRMHMQPNRFLTFQKDLTGCTFHKLRTSVIQHLNNKHYCSYTGKISQQQGIQPWTHVTLPPHPLSPQLLQNRNSKPIG